MWNPPPEHPLRRLFAGFTEQTFQSRFGVADPDLIDYLSALLSRFVHVDAVHRLRDAAGRRLDQVVDMVADAADLPPEGRTAREVHRHIGDFALFWTGVYPEALERVRSRHCKDHFVDYTVQGTVAGPGRVSIAAAVPPPPANLAAAPQPRADVVP